MKKMLQCFFYIVFVQLSEILWNFFFLVCVAMVTICIMETYIHQQNKKQKKKKMSGCDLSENVWVVLIEVC